VYILLKCALRKLIKSLTVLFNEMLRNNSEKINVPLLAYLIHTDEMFSTVDKQQATGCLVCSFASVAFLCMEILLNQYYKQVIKLTFDCCYSCIPTRRLLLRVQP